MADKHTPEQRRNNMRAIRSKDTKIELILRKELWKRGLRYRKNYNQLIGKPDIVFLNKRLVIFCDSEFWHGYNWLEAKNKIDSNQKYWFLKIEKNIERDKKVNSKLEELGFTVLRFWAKDIMKDVKKCADIIEDHLD